MTAAELSRLKAETEMAKAVFVACKKRYEDAQKVSSKKVKVETPNRFIQKQLRKAS